MRSKPSLIGIPRLQKLLAIMPYRQKNKNSWLNIVILLSTWHPRSRIPRLRFNLMPSSILQHVSPLVRSLSIMCPRACPENWPFGEIVWNRLSSWAQLLQWSNVESRPTAMLELYGGCPKYLFPDSPQSLSQSRSNRGTTVSNRGRVCSSLIRSYT